MVCYRAIPASVLHPFHTGGMPGLSICRRAVRQHLTATTQRRQENDATVWRCSALRFLPPRQRERAFYGGAATTRRAGGGLP